VIGRFDQYNAAVNTKASLIGSVQIFLLGSLALKAEDIMCLAHHVMLAKISLAMLLLLICGSALYSLVLCLRAAFPYLQGNNPPKSLIFFKEISERYTPSEFIHAHDQVTDESYAHDLAEQAVYLSKGLTSKFELTRKSMLAIIRIQLPTLTTLVIIIIGSYFL
jgi:hypothetical protein